MFEMPSSDEKELKITKEYSEAKITKSALKKLRAVS
jgi:ATP-dependent Clp protease ATP-binding subunit ClpX